MSKKYTILFNLLMLFGMIAILSCQNELSTPDIQGGLRVTLSNVSPAVTRATPSELGAPTEDRFRIKVEDTRGFVKYNGPLTDDIIKVIGGTYTVTAECGENPIIALDKPYYIGTTQVEVVTDQVTDASINCTVGNALLSVIFGRDENERERFNKFYKEYALNVKVGNYGVAITNYLSDASAYFRAGSTVALEFTGVTRNDGVLVRHNLDMQSENAKDFPKPFQAADHAIVTLSLPDPESALGVDISKVEVETVTLDETIPLSWLPVPQATSKHQYDETGNLVGTNLMFSNSYPGMTWKAEVMKAGSTDILRTVEGTGDLTSAYTDSNDWPYLPSGSYTAKFYLQMNGTLSQTSSRTFTIQKPENLKITVDAFTSYSKYLEEDGLAVANEAGPNGEVGFYGRKIRNVSARLMVADNIINDAKYASLKSNVTATVDDIALSGTATGHTFFLAYTNDLSRARHTISVSGSFDGSSATASKNFEVTGIPYLADSETAFSEWAPGGDYSKWADDTPTTQEGDGAGTCYYFRGDNKVSWIYKLVLSLWICRDIYCF